MADIHTFPFEEEKLEKLKEYHLGTNWPVVYLQENGKEMYIGQTTNIYGRSKQHFENPNRRRLKKIHVVSDMEFNMSAAHDFESLLIQYISADNKFKLQNGNGGLVNHNYYEREKYIAKFETLWPSLQAKELVVRDLAQLKNSDFFKFSPYKALNTDQLIVARRLKKKIAEQKQKAYIVSGGPGTGKTVLALYMLKYLLEDEKTKHLQAALVVPMTSLRATLQKVIRRVPGMRADMVIGPADVAKKQYDLLLVDEAHRLRRRVNVPNFKPFDDVNKKLGLPKDGTQLDWIMKTSAQQIFFYDEKQNVTPGDIRLDDMRKVQAERFELVSQMRVEGGEDYIRFIENWLALESVNHPQHYDFKVCESVHELVDSIKQKDKEHSLGRVVAGYAWPWSTKDGKSEYDIEIDGLKLVWNSTNIDWVNSKNSVNEVGCIHTIQGYDLNYVGVIIGPEVSYDEEKDELVIDPQKYKDINGKRSITSPEELKGYILNIYKTLLTRGIKGTYVYVVDDALRNKLQKLLVS